MHDDRRLITDRLARVLRERLLPATRETIRTLEIAAWHVEGEPVPPAEALRYAGYKPFSVGESWGPPWGTTWFHLTGDVPASDDVEIVVDLGWSDHSPGFQCEGLVYRPDGTVVKGLNPRNDWIPVVAPRVDLFVEA